MARRRDYEIITVGPLSEFPGDVQAAYQRQKPTHFACLPDGSVIIATNGDALWRLQQMWADVHGVKVDGTPLTVMPKSKSKKKS